LKGFLASADQSRFPVHLGASLGEGRRCAVLACGEEGRPMADRISQAGSGDTSLCADGRATAWSSSASAGARAPCRSRASEPNCSILVQVSSQAIEKHSLLVPAVGGRIVSGDLPCPCLSIAAWGEATRPFARPQSKGVFDLRQ